MFSGHVLASLLQNIVYVVLFVIVGNRVYPSVVHWSPFRRSLVSGFLFGCAGIVTLLVPIEAGQGAIISLKNVLVALSGWTGGPWSAVVTAAMVAGYRFSLGGVGIWAGIPAILVSAVIGVAFKYRIRKPKASMSHWKASLAMGLLMTANSLAWTFVLPEETWRHIYEQFALILLLFYPFATLMLHFFMIEEWNRIYHSEIDTVTELPRLNKLKKAMSRSIRGRSPFAVALLDIEDLPTRIELNGYSFGDELRRQFGHRLRTWMPASALVGRSGTDAFLLYVPHQRIGSSADALTAFFRELKDILSLPFRVGEETLTLSVGMGTAVYSGGEAVVHQLLLQADTALKHAKQLGSARAVRYEDQLTKRMRRRLQLETGLRSALGNREFELVYQPQYDMRSGAMRGFETLLRWQHPELGAVSPAEFIPLLEESGLIVPVGEWVLGQACEALARLAPSPSRLTMAVNVSAKQLDDDSFPLAVGKAVRRSGIEAHRLELELTETSLPSSIERAQEQLKKLRELGVRLALDDFGTLYSSLNYLRKLPVDLIKLDGSFLKDIGKAETQELIGSLLQFIKRLKFEVVAEGLESYDQLAFLQEHRCDFAQGFLFSRPIPEDQLQLLMRETNSQ